MGFLYMSSNSKLYKAGKISIKLIFLILLILFIIQFSWQMSGSNKWELEIDKNGVQVYSLKSPGSSKILTKGIITFESNLHGPVAFLQDHVTCQEFGCKKAEVFYRGSEQFYFSEFHYPMPYGMKDREFVVTSTFYQDPKSKVIYYHHISEPDLLPPNDGVFRMINFYVRYRITPLENGKIAFEMTRDIDVGGMFPGLMYSQFAVGELYNLVQNLAKYAQKEKYQNTNFEFVKENKV